MTAAVGEGQGLVAQGDSGTDDEGASEARSDRPGERALLWVESVSERLLGGQGPRPWERVYFDRDSDSVSEGSVAPEAAPSAPPAGPSEAPPVSSSQQPQVPTGQPTHHDTREGTSVTVPASTFAEQPAPFTELGSPHIVDLTAADASPASLPPETAPSAGSQEEELLRSALRSGDAGLAGAVIDLLDSGARDRARLDSLERALRVLLYEIERNPESAGVAGGAGAPVVTVLRRVLRS